MRRAGTAGRRAAVVLVGALALLCSRNARAGDWDAYYDAERSAKDLLFTYYDDFKKMDRSAIQALVQAICDADEEERKSVASDVGSKTRDRVRAEYDKVEKRKNEAVAMLDKVLADDRFKEKHSDARDLKNKVEERWKSIDKMYDSVRSSNHPVSTFMTDKGMEEHKYRQGRCTAAEFETGNGPADCIGYDGNACLIVELKPDNSKAIGKGKTQAERYRDALISNPDKRKELDGKSSSFASCPQKFDTRVDCYKLCPDIDEDGNFRSVSASWRTGC